MESVSGAMSDGQLHYAINHAFLPPMLPHRDDYSIAHVQTFVKFVASTLDDFTRRTLSDNKAIANAAVELMNSFLEIHEVGESKISILSAQLSGKLRQLCEIGGSALLHVHAQNSGILLNRVGDNLHFEILELTPSNKDVHAAEGRLVRHFPGHAIAVPVAIMLQADHIDSLASTLSTLSSQESNFGRPESRKAGSRHKEVRESTNPIVVTKYLSGLLLALGSPVEVRRIRKNTREEVMWKNCVVPWTRSPTWLLFRAALQLTMQRLQHGQPESLGHEKTLLYKEFIAFLLADLLRKACLKDFDSDLVSTMTSKLSYRLRKMGAPTSDWLVQDAETIVKDANRLLSGRWKQICAEASPAPELSILSNLDHQRDINAMNTKLDEHLQYLARLGGSQQMVDFTPKNTLDAHNPAHLPSINHSESDYATMHLAAVEDWVEMHLDAWLKGNISEPSTCASLSKLTRDYYELASTFYKNNPEATSLMILTCIELWVCCNKSAHHICSLLQSYHESTVPDTIIRELLQSLILPHRSQLERLRKIEKYLTLCSGQSRRSLPSIFTGFGHAESFYVRYFESSTEQKTLRENIESEASQERARKRAEYTTKRRKYEELMAEYNLLDHVWANRMDYWGRKQAYHDTSACRKCHALQEAEAMSIEVHEWPLPKSVADLKNAVFELKPPQWFPHWRDGTALLILRVLSMRYSLKSAPKQQYRLDQYSGLARYVFTAPSNQKFSAVSEDKPFKVAHYAHKTIGSIIIESEILVDHALHYQYYDSHLSQYTASFVSTDILPQQCMFKLPSKDAALQQFLLRPGNNPDGPSPNTVIASQHACPEDMTLPEYRELCSIPLGHLLQWQNILRQLHAPTVDFNTSTTFFFILQCATQAGPPHKTSELRASHAILRDTGFTTELLNGLKAAESRLSESWQSNEAFRAFILLATRTLSLTSDAATASRCLEFLQSARRTVLRWAYSLRDKARDSSSSESRAKFRSRAARCALVCALSFDVDQHHVASVIRSDDARSVFLQCALIAHEGVGVMHGADDLLHWRWQRVCYRLLPTLVRDLTRVGSTAADDAIKKYWPQHGEQSSWHSVSPVHPEWLVGRGSSENSYQVHFNILTGDLLVNGLPLNRLPDEYERHEIYRSLFGASILDVMPSNIAGFMFSTAVPFAGHNVNFAIDLSSRQLNIRAEREGKVLKFLPRDLLTGFYPKAFVHGFVHWYDEEKDLVEFRAAAAPWKTESQCWKLKRTREGDPWQLVKDGTFVCPLGSPTSSALAEILSPIEVETRIHCLYSRQLDHLDVDLPNLQIRFYLDKNDQTLCCKDFRDTVVDPDQNIGTLVGLSDKLVLKSNKNTGERLVLIPHGSLSSSKTAAHVRVGVEKPDQSFVHAFRVDTLLGCLIDGGDLLSKAFLCHLHALTSFCLPDPHTGRSGTEEALRILRSAAMRSFSTLDEESIRLLRVIADITPRRQFYPKHLEVMQTVSWSSNLGFLAQHDDFIVAVGAILEQAEDNKFFHKSHPEINPQDIWDHQERRLMIRNRIRHSYLRVATFGAEHKHTCVDKTYSARDTGAASDVRINTYRLAKDIHRGAKSSHRSIADDLHAHLWNFLRPSQVVNVSDDFDLKKLAYGSPWLLPWGQGSKEFLTENWLNLHALLISSNAQRKKFAVMAWLSAIACAGNSDATVVHIIASFFTDAASMGGIVRPLSMTAFDLSKGIEPVDEQILRAVTSGKKVFDPSKHIIETINEDETIQEFHHRGRQSWENRAAAAAADFVGYLKRQWPCPVPNRPRLALLSTVNTYFLMDSMMPRILHHFRIWYENFQFHNYLREVCNIVSTQVESLKVPDQPCLSVIKTKNKSLGSVSISAIFSRPAPMRPIFQIDDLSKLLRKVPTSTSTSANARSAREKLAALISSSKDRARSTYEKEYVTDLQTSERALQQRDISPKKLGLVAGAREEHIRSCEQEASAIYRTIFTAITQGAFDIYQWPRISPFLLLEQLNRHHWTNLSGSWKALLIEYALALTRLQHAKRIIQACDSDLVKELSNYGHTNWIPEEHPEWLLLEVESGILIREVQVQIARRMHSPADDQNSVMQLNMGEGKSSVIVPMLVTSLADSNKLMRVLVAKPQSKQMMHMLTSKLGGLVDRQVFHLPFSRAVPVGSSDLAAIESLLTRCRDEGGVLLVQPEHILSFQLMGIEKKIAGASTTADKLLELHEFMRDNSRDVVDESDENFSPRFELVYSLGVQQAVDHSPERWTVIQEVLDIVRKCLGDVQKAFPSGTEIQSGTRGSFPRTRIIDAEAMDELLNLLTERFCSHGLKGFPITKSEDRVRDAVHKYIRYSKPDSEVKAAVEIPPPVGFWTEATKNTLMLLRGLVGCGILSFALGQKRWRVDYGLDGNRSPPTSLAVPYRAKDHPSTRSEFSHPDVVIVLTCLSYYYQGLTDDQLAAAFAHLDRCDQRDDEYAAWVKDANDLARSLQHLNGVNLEDPDLCERLFPCFRFSKATIDYFLAHIIFTKQMKEFPNRLSASGWDIGEVKRHPTTGFSGTNDAKVVLPLNVKQDPLPDQVHTNALVLQYLLQPENSVASIPSMPQSLSEETLQTNADQLLDMVVAMQPPVRVILDVGAQIIELDNLGVAKKWLSLLTDHNTTEAAVFVDGQDNICVIDRKGRIEPLFSSPYSTQLRLCVIFLDDAHTRGTDLKLPENYRAAVTLGANLVKDRTVQACMRMRKLGHGQSVVFCVSEEIQRKIHAVKADRSTTANIDVADVLAWVISETWQDARRSTSLWAMQGRRHERHHELWSRARNATGFSLSEEEAREFLADEAELIETRYRPKSIIASDDLSPLSETQSLIEERCRKIDALGVGSATLQEEQERELAPEVEEQRQLERPPEADPLKHSIHPDVRNFIRTGVFSGNSRVFIKVYKSLMDSSAKCYIEKLQSRSTSVYCTRDFHATIKPPPNSYISDSYQRPVQWILTQSTRHGSSATQLKYMVIISPFEAQQLMSDIQKSKHVVLHLYAPLVNPAFRSLDKLDLYTVPQQNGTLHVPQKTITELNLFAGQLYFKNLTEFEALLKYLQDVASVTNGAKPILDENLVSMLNIVMMRIRRNCETIDKTHTGKALDCRVLTQDDL